MPTPTLPLTLGLVLAAAQDPAPSPVTDGPSLEPVTTVQRDGTEVSLERGVLRVPVVRDAPDGGEIALEFHRFPGPGGEDPAPPIFVLQGGPGFRGLGPELSRKGFYEDQLRTLARVADVVVVGQRGIGSSTPDTACGGVQREALDPPPTEEERALALVNACKTCKERWEAEGLDLSGLNVIEAAADVIDVADALGYGKITIVGGSFGSHWGMALMRYHPTRVERAVLRGLEGPDHTYDMPSHVLNALKRIATAAEASPELAEHIPDGGLIRALETVIQELEESPKLIEVGTVELRLDARRIREHALGYTARASSREGMKTWPLDVIRLARGEFETVAQVIVRRNFFPRLPTASFFMLDCGSGISAARHAELLADPAAAIVGPLGWFYDTACPVWGSDLGEDFRAGFETDIPTVLVHGTWDVSTPFENALELESSFKNSKLVVVEGGSHGALGEALVASPEFRRALSAFLATGDMEPVPGLIEMPTPNWAVPGD